MTRTLRKLPFLLILATAVVGAIFLRDKISFEALAQHRAALLAYRDAHFMQASLGFVAAYFVIVAFSLPGATIASLTGGFLFGMFPGTLYNLVGATSGAIAVFLAARAGFGADVAARMSSGAAGRVKAALQENQWSALLLLRLMPAVPFFLANLIPAFLGIRLVPFAVTTLVGIIPGALVLTGIGVGLGEVFARGETPDLGILFTPQIVLPLLGLAGLAALPIVVKLFRKGT